LATRPHREFLRLSKNFDQFSEKITIVALISFIAGFILQFVTLCPLFTFFLLYSVTITFFFLRRDVASTIFFLFYGFPVRPGGGRAVARFLDASIFLDE
jgi:hypothetical protein